ncbi:hypothetical protein ACQ856_30250 (plasmid) [Mycolicibacterium psychrotolerans]|uniref:hypothetical protein n=1 Tax=Mycolicibacterium psychrotolerans TaxID=216929 RepID=UPI003D674FAF
MSPGAPALALALGAVRKTSGDLIGYAAQAPDAALGWRFFAARRAAGLSLDEAAHAVGLEPAAVYAAEGVFRSTRPPLRRCSRWWPRSPGSAKRFGRSV